jgi:hypothetical protein
VGGLEGIDKRVGSRGEEKEKEKEKEKQKRKCDCKSKETKENPITFKSQTDPHTHSRA